MSETLLVVQFVLAVLLTILILLQKSSSMGLGAYSGSNESVFGAKGPAGFLSKATFILGFVFVLNTVALGYFYNQEINVSVAEEIKSDVPSAPASSAPASSTPAAPAAPHSAPTTK